jgi:hypothetical protein
MCVKTPQLPFQEESFQIIRKVCKLLKDRYIVAFPISETFFRVHISKGVNVDFGPRLHKYLFTYLWAMEFQLDKFHPVEVSTNEDDMERQSFHCPWNGVVREMRKRAANNDPMTACDVVERILSCKTGDEVIELMNYPDVWGDQKYETLSLQTPIVWDFGAPGLLVNFHEGTLDAQRVENWVRVWIRIFQFLDSFDENFTYFEDFIRGVPDGKNYSPQDLLGDIGLPELVEFYQPQFDEHAKLGDRPDNWMYYPD